MASWRSTPLNWVCRRYQTPPLTHSHTHFTEDNADGSGSETLNDDVLISGMNNGMYSVYLINVSDHISVNLETFSQKHTKSSIVLWFFPRGFHSGTVQKRTWRWLNCASVVSNSENNVVGALCSLLFCIFKMSSCSLFVSFVVCCHCWTTNCPLGTDKVIYQK